MDRVRHTEFVLNALPQFIQIWKKVFQKGILGRLPSNNHSRPQNDRMFEAELFDGILHATLHLRVGQVGKGWKSRSGSSTGDEHIGRYTRHFRGPGVLDAQIMVDLPLVPNPAGRRACGADGVEYNRWLGRQGGDQTAPFSNVAFFEGLQLGRLDVWQSPWDGLHGGKYVGGEECREDLRADCSSTAEHHCRSCHGKGWIVRRSSTQIE